MTSAAPSNRRLGGPAHKVVHVVTGLNQGGAEAMLVRMLEASGEPGRFHVVSLADDGYYGAQLRGMGIGLTCLEIRGPVTAMVAMPRMVRLFRQLRPEIVQTWDVPRGSLGRRGGAPRGRPEGDLGNSAKQRGYPHIKPATMRVARVSAWLSRRLPDRIVSCSHRAAEAHVAFGYDPSVIVVLPNGFDLARFRAGPVGPSRAKARAWHRHR